MPKTRRETRILYLDMTPSQKRAAKAGNASALARRRRKDMEQKRRKRIEKDKG